MTDIRNDDFTTINSIDDVIPLYQGNHQPLEEQRIGFETEICIYRKHPDGPLTAATSKECADLLQYLKDLGHAPQLEMASAVEYASPAFRVKDVGALVKEIKRDWNDYLTAIRDKGFEVSDAALLSFVTLESAGENLVDRDRARGLVKGMKLFKAVEFLKITLLATSTQVSLSYKDKDDLYDLLTTGYALQAPIFALFANYPAYIEGKKSRIDFNPRAAFYDGFGKDGGIPDSLLTAKDGDEFIRNHAKQVFETKLLFYYDQNQQIVWPQKPVTFEGLKELGLNTRSNYDLAETFIYTDFKVCNIRDSEGRPTGKRVEVRGFDAGELGVFGSVPFTHALLRDPDTRDQVKGLLAEYGLSPDQEGYTQNVKQARSNAAWHEGKYLDVDFGVKEDGKPGNLKKFCQELGVVLSLYAQRHPELQEELKPVIEICNSGVSVAERKAQVTKTYSHAAEPKLQRSL